MALNATDLGTALYNFRNSFNNKTVEELIQAYGTIEAARLQSCIGEAEVIINYLKNNAEGVYQNGSLIAGPNPVTKVGTTVAIKLQ